MISPSWITAEFVKTLSVMADYFFFNVEKKYGSDSRAKSCAK